MRQIQPNTSRGQLRATAAASFLALVASCHSHDDGNNVASFVPPAGSSGSFSFSLPGANGEVQRGEFVDVLATLPSGAGADIVDWRIFTGPGGSLADRGLTDEVRFVAGNPGFYAIEATDAQGNVGYYGFNVIPDPTTLRVNEVMPGTDDDEVNATLASSGANDLFLAERIGGTSAPQILARINRAGDRVMTRTVGYKVPDMAADDAGNVTLVRSAAATFPEAILRVDRDLNDVGSFMAPDLGAAMWRDIVAMTRTGETLVPTDHNGGSLLRLDSNGAPVGGTIEDSLYPLGLPFADVVDVTTDIDGAVYVATESRIVRVGTNGDVDTMFWSSDAQTAIRSMATDEDGVLFFAAQDADGGQCGSIRQLNWRGQEFRRTTSLIGQSEFAARKVLTPVSLAVFPNGSWRLYDDIVTLNPAFQRAAWILASELGESQP